jgi:hypothetical protein
MFTLMSGQTVSVQQYMQMMSEFMNATAGMVPTYTLSRMYPNFNKSTLTQTGEYDPTHARVTDLTAVMRGFQSPYARAHARNRLGKLSGSSQRFSTY